MLDPIFLDPMDLNPIDRVCSGQVPPKGAVPRTGVQPIGCRGGETLVQHRGCYQWGETYGVQHMAATTGESGAT